MDMKDRFNKAFAYLQGKQLIKGQKDLAEKMGAAPANISKALNGDQSALTSNLMKRFCAAFPGIFNLHWLIMGEGDMLAASQMAQEAMKEAQPTSAPSANEEWYRSQIKELTTMLNNAYTLIARLQQENEMLRGFSIYGTQVAESDVKPYGNFGEEK